MAKRLDEERERQHNRGQKDYLAGEYNPPNDFLGGHFNLEGGKRNRDAYISGWEDAKEQGEEAWHLNTKSLEVEELVTALAAMTGESKTEAVRRSLVERRERLSLQSTSRRRGTDFLRYLEEEVWPKAPPDQLGRRLSRDEEDDILGYGPEGV